MGITVLVHILDLGGHFYFLQILQTPIYQQESLEDPTSSLFAFPVAQSDVQPQHLGCTENGKKIFPRSLRCSYADVLRKAPSKFYL